MIIKPKIETVAEARDALIAFANTQGIKVYYKKSKSDWEKGSYMSKAVLTLLTFWCWLISFFGVKRDHNVSIANAIDDEIWLPTFENYGNRDEHDYIALRHELTHALRKRETRFWSLRWLLSRRFRAVEENIAYRESIMARYYVIFSNWHLRTRQKLLINYDSKSTDDVKDLMIKLRAVRDVVEYYCNSMSGPLYAWTWTEKDCDNFKDWANLVRIDLVHESLYDQNSHYDDMDSMLKTINHGTLMMGGWSLKKEIEEILEMRKNAFRIVPTFNNGSEIPIIEKGVDALTSFIASNYTFEQFVRSDKLDELIKGIIESGK